jgi:hypothetical protein
MASLPALMAIKEMGFLIDVKVPWSASVKRAVVKLVFFIF